MLPQGQREVELSGAAGKQANQIIKQFNGADDIREEVNMAASIKL